MGLDFATQYDPSMNLSKKHGEYKEILWWYRYYIWKWLGKTLLYSPLIGCPICMSSVYGTIMFFVFYHTSNSLMYVPFILAVAGCNRLILGILKKLEE